MAAALATVCCAPVATVAKASSSKPRFTGLAKIALTPSTNEFAAKTVSNGVTTRAMLVWAPTDNKYFETLSFLPPLTDEQILKQIEYCVSSGWVPCLEFAEASLAAISNENTTRMLGSAVCGFYDNRYWTMYKLPMFGCSDSSQVLAEIQNCMKTFPGAYVRLVAFDNVRQVQCASFVVHRPEGAGYAKVEDRSK